MFLRISVAAFFATEQTRAAFEGLQIDRRLARSRVVVQGGGIDGAVRFLTENKPGELVIVETRGPGEDLAESLARLAEVCDPNLKVIVVGQDNDIDLYRQLIGMGLSDYLATPVDVGRLMDSIETIFGDADNVPKGRVIAFMGARGGVGSSTLAANTAHALGQIYGEKVVVLDLDLPFGTAGLTFNLRPTQGIEDAFAQSSRLDEVMMERYLTDCGDHLSVVSVQNRLNGGAQIQVETFEVLLGLIAKMSAFVVLDIPHVWASWVDQVLMFADDMVLVAYPDLANLRDAKNILDAVKSKREADASARLVLNRVGVSKRSELSTGDFAARLNMSRTATIPFVPTLFGSAMNEGVSVSEINAKSEPSRQIFALAATLSGRKQAPKPKFISLFRRKK